MKRHLLTAILWLFGVSNTFSQTFEWAQQFSGKGSFDYGRSLGLDNWGNVYTTGDFSGTTDFDPGTGVFNLIPKNNRNSAYVCKLDYNGNFVWAIQIAGNVSCRSMIVDTWGNQYITGHFTNTADFDPDTAKTYNLTAKGKYQYDDIFILKLDPSGKFLWVKQMGGNSNDIGYSICKDISGSIFISGCFGDTADFDPGSGIFNLSTGQVTLSAFICKLNASGNFIWAKKLADTWSVSYGLTVDFTGNVLATGFFSDSTDFDPGAGVYTLTSKGKQDIFISKFSTTGNFIYARQMGGPNTDIGYSIIIDSWMNIYVAGVFQRTCDFDPGPGKYNLSAQGLAINNDGFVTKLDTAGNFLWAKQYGETSDDDCFTLALDNQDNIYVGGQFQNIVDFDPGNKVYNIKSKGGSDVFISKLDGMGNLIWVRTFGGSGYDATEKIVISNFNDVYTTGAFWSSVDFDPDTGSYVLTSAMRSDIFVHKIRQRELIDGLFEDKHDSYLTIYPNPSNGIANISYIINERADIKLRVYDILGKEVSELVNDQQPAGNYNYIFSAPEAGVYLVKLHIDRLEYNKKLIISQ